MTQRVVIATDRYPTLTSAQAGAALGTAGAVRGAQVAVVPIGVAGHGLGEALADLWSAQSSLLQIGDRTVTVAWTASHLVVSVHEPADPGHGPHWDGGSEVVGQALVAALAEHHPGRTIVLDVSAPTWQDGGRGLLAALGVDMEGVDVSSAPIDLGPARAALAGAELVLAAPSDELTALLVGLRGITSRAAHAHSEAGHGAVDPETMLRRDQALVDLGAAAGAADQTLLPGSGAVGGLGWAVLALGGRVLSGPELCSEQAGLPGTIAQSDLVVTGGARLDFGTMGGDVLSTVRTAAQDALRPCVVIAGVNFISSRELRSIGVEDAYPVRRPGPDEDEAGAAPITADELLAVARQVAATWSW